MQDELETKVYQTLELALSYRSKVVLPEPSSTPQAVLDSLLDARVKADTVESMYLSLVRIRARAVRKVAAIKAEHEDAWNQALVDMKSGSRQRDQYEGPRERYAEADLATLMTKRQLRKAEETLGIVDEGVDILRTAFRGLNEIIQDHRVWLKSLQFQTYLEK